MRTSVKYLVIYRHKEKYSISEMCKFFAVSRSGYYDYVEQCVIDTKRKDTATVKVVFQEAYPTVYILQDFDSDEYYITDESNLIKYDKYWFDRQEENEEQ